MRHCLCLDSAHIPGLKDMVLWCYICVFFHQAWEAGVLASCGDSSIPVSWRSVGSDEGWGRFP